MTALDPKFAKVVALMRSTSHPGEQESARGRAEAMAAAAGMTLKAAIKASDAAAAKTSAADIFAGLDDAMEAAHPGYKAEQAADRRFRIEAWRKRKADILARYGSIESVLAPCEREKALLRAVERWRVPYDANPRWTDELDGWEGRIDDGDAPPHVLQAIRDALLLPATFTAAKLEADYWRMRNAEMEDVLAEEAGGGLYDGDCALDLVAEVRWNIVRDLVEHEIPVTTLTDLHARFAILRADETGSEAIEAALFRDIEAMARREADAGSAAAPSPPASVHNGQIERTLEAHPDWSDRRIARAAGCSPTTVGKVRRSIGAAAETRSVQRGGQTYTFRVAEPAA